MFRPDSASAPPSASARHLPTELLRRYVAGELPPAEEHAVEAHTLACDQCAEVLEGLEMQPAAVTDASLTNLRHRLHARVAELAAEAEPAARPLASWWRPLAAAAVLLLSLGVVGWLLLRGEPQTWELASRPTYSVPVPPGSGPAPDEAAVESAAPAPGPERAAGAAVASAPVTPPAAAPAPRPAHARPRLTRHERAVAQVPVPQQPAENVTADAVMGEAETAGTAMITPNELRNREVAAAKAGRPPTEAAPAEADMALASAPEATRTIQGRVTDMAGQPMPGATVLVPGTQTGTSTASDGSFSLTVPATTPQLSVSSIGYTSQTRPLRPTDSTLALALVPNQKQLSEVVVRREAPPGLPSIGPLPAGGYAAFRQYLRDSLAYPEKAREKHLEGYVRLQFVVGPTGQLSGFKVVSRLSPECDEEAIRLVKEGPAWFPGVQNNCRTARKVELNVPFTLERR